MTDQLDRLHIGCGQSHLEGWVNIDNQQLPGTDLVLDVRQGLPFQNVAAIFAEHFLEHLSLDEGLAFLRECRRVLSSRGTLRLSTPNLDWVILTHYHFGAWSSQMEALNDCLTTNRAFRGWGHQFLYNEALLAAALRSVGFANVTPQAYGESQDPLLRGLEGHERSQDTANLPHVLVMEASGQAAPVPLPSEALADYLRDVQLR